MISDNREPDQRKDITEFQGDTWDAGDAPPITVLVLKRIEPNNESAAARNTAVFQSAIDSSIPGTFFRLPDGTLYFERLNIPHDKRGLTIQGDDITIIAKGE